MRSIQNDNQLLYMEDKNQIDPIKFIKKFLVIGHLY